MNHKGEKKAGTPLLLKTIALLLITAGALLIVCVLAAGQVVKRQQKDLLDSYEAAMAALPAQTPALNGEEGAAVPVDILPGDLAEASDGEAASGGASSLQPICLLRIPKIDLDVVVAEGTSDSVLRYAVGHFKDTAMPGEVGNFALSGHRSYAFGQFFNRLDELEAGDSLIVERDDKSYTYKVSEIMVVEPEDVWVLDKTEDAQITLVTCTPIRVATHRLIVKGVLEG